jgi:hypothetical protein
VVIIAQGTSFDEAGIHALYDSVGRTTSSTGVSA